MAEFRAPRLTGSFSFTQLGNAAEATLDFPPRFGGSPLRHPEALKDATTGVHWGDCLRPHHFNFDDATPVRPRVATRNDIICRAVSVLGAGQFKEAEGSEGVAFENGGVIVKGGDRYKFLTLEVFRKHFVLEGGGAIESVFQIDYQTPKK